VDRDISVLEASMRAILGVILVLLRNTSRRRGTSLLKCLDRYEHKIPHQMEVAIYQFNAINGLVDQCPNLKRMDS
jgi:hypothetical protein